MEKVGIIRTFTGSKSRLIRIKLHKLLQIYIIPTVRNAVISQRNGRLFLIFRIGNMRSSHMIQAQVRAQLVHKVGIEI